METSNHILNKTLCKCRFSAMTRVLVFALLILPSTSYAQNLTSEQKQFRSSIFSFLQEEGFMPYIDEEDNSLTFKKEGILYWINVSGENALFIHFRRSGLKIDNESNIDLIYRTCNEVNRKISSAKVYAVNNEMISIGIEMYCHSAEEFKYVFYKSISTLDKAKTMLNDTYNELASNQKSNPNGATFVVNSVEIANTNKERSIITDYGKTIYSYNSQYITPRLNVRVSKPGPCEIYIKFYTPNGLSTGSKSPQGYSYKSSVQLDTDDAVITLTGWGGADDGHWSSGNYRFEFYCNDKIIAQKSFTIY